MAEFNTKLKESIKKVGFSSELIQILTTKVDNLKRVTSGYCPICERETVYIAKNDWLRDHYLCVQCNSIPRHRALIKVLSQLRPHWRSMIVHESSPAGPLLVKFKAECQGYSYSYFDENSDPGSKSTFGGGNCTNQNLECMTFKDESFDVFITQDVFEHIVNPSKAWAEIARVLKPGGIHIFTVPLYPFIATRSRICVENGNIVPVLPPIYHGNPISSKGSLVTYDWGHDIVDKIRESSGMQTQIHEFTHTEENHRNGLEADFLWVLSSWKEKGD